MEKKNNIDLALYRLQRAREEYETSELLYRENKFLAANNRAYYSIFYAIRAVLAMERVDFKKHKDVLAYFNKNYISTEIFPKNMGRKIVQASRIREDSDYDDEFIVDKEKTFEQIITAEELIELIGTYINNK